MHYGAFAFAKNRQRPTIIAKKNNGQLGQRKGFSSVIPPPPQLKTGHLTLYFYDHNKKFKCIFFFNVTIPTGMGI